MAKIIHERVDDPSEADSYERASAFLSEWIEDSVAIVPAASEDVHQNHTKRRFSLPEVGLTSRPLRRRATLSNPTDCTIDSCASDEAIDSLVNSLRATLLTYQNPSSHSGINSDTMSPSSTTTVLYKEGEQVGVPFLPFEGSPNVAQPIFPPLERVAAVSAARSARERRHFPCITLRRRSSGGDKDEVKSNNAVYKHSIAHLKNEQGPMQKGSSRRKQEKKSATKPPRRSQNHRRHTFDCDRNFNSCNKGYVETIKSDNEDVLHSSLGSLCDQRRSSSRFNDHGPNANCVRRGEDPPTMVVSLPWNGGLYTGQVNTLVQPHGSGVLHQDSGNFVKGVWNNGNLTTSSHSSKSSLATSSVLKKKIVHKGAGIYRDDPAPSGNEDVNPSDGSEEKESSKTKKSSHKKSMAVQDESFADSTYNRKASVQPSAQHPLDRLCELDGPPDFDLGDKSPTTKYQIIQSDPNEALRSIDQLRVHDFAWILRSSREWTYAIVADFPKQENDECIRFVIDKMGNTKTLQKKYWAKCIRLVGSGKNRLC